ncbi:MAG: hypothetical protein ACREJ2_12700 [Planctomycetota bacterium]
MPTASQRHRLNPNPRDSMIPTPPGNLAPIEPGLPFTAPDYVAEFLNRQAQLEFRAHDGIASAVKDLLAVTNRRERMGLARAIAHAVHCLRAEDGLSPHVINLVHEANRLIAQRPIPPLRRRVAVDHIVAALCRFRADPGYFSGDETPDPRLRLRLNFKSCSTDNPYPDVLDFPDNLILVFEPAAAAGTAAAVAVAQSEPVPVPATPIPVRPAPTAVPVAVPVAVPAVASADLRETRTPALATNNQNTPVAHLNGSGVRHDPVKGVQPVEDSKAAAIVGPVPVAATQPTIAPPAVPPAELPLAAPADPNEKRPAAVPPPPRKSNGVAARAVAPVSAAVGLLIAVVCAVGFCGAPPRPVSSPVAVAAVAPGATSLPASPPAGVSEGTPSQCAERGFGSLPWVAQGGADASDALAEPKRLFEPSAGVPARGPGEKRARSALSSGNARRLARHGLVSPCHYGMRAARVRWCALRSHCFCTGLATRATMRRACERDGWTSGAEWADWAKKPA